LVWDTDRWQPVELKPTYNQVTHVAFNGAGDLVASRSWDYVIRLWDIAARRELIQVPGGSQWAPLTFNRDDTALAFAHDGSEGSIFNVATGRELRRLVTRAPQQVEGNSDSPFRAMDFSHDGSWLIVGNDGHSHLWDLRTGRETVLPIPMPVIGYQQPVKVAFSADGTELLCAGEEGIERWPIELGSSRGELRIGPPETVHEDLRNFFSVSDQHILGLARSSYDQVALLEKSIKGAKVIVSHRTPTTAVVDPHGKWLATAAWKEPDVKVWDASNGELLHAIPAVSPVCISLSPDGRLLCVGTENAYRGVDTKTWQSRFVIPRRRALGASGHSVFSDDGKLMAVCSSFATLQLIDAKNGAPIAELQTPHESRIGYFCFNHGGDRLAVRYLATDAVEIWDLREIRRQLAELDLDWDLTPYAPPPKRDSMPLEVIVDAGPPSAESGGESAASALSQ
jgi:WD40 repeat protein